MTFWDWAALTAICTIGATSPGPSLVYIVQTALSRGRVSGIVTTWAHAVGVGVYAALAAWGFAALITSFPTLYIAIRWAGAAFLLYLAWKALRRSGTANQTAGARPASPGKRVGGVLGGFLMAVLNPKILVWYVSLFSQFTSPTSSTGERLGIVGLAMGIDGVWYTLVVLFLTVDRRLQWFRRQEGWMNRVFALLLFGIALRIVAE